MVFTVLYENLLYVVNKIGAIHGHQECIHVNISTYNIMNINVKYFYMLGRYINRTSMNIIEQQTVPSNAVVWSEMSVLPEKKLLVQSPRQHQGLLRQS